MNEPEYVDPRTLRLGPIRHKSLPPDLLGQIRAVYDVIGPYVGMTLEQFEIGFMRDMHAIILYVLFFSSFSFFAGSRPLHRQIPHGVQPCLYDLLRKPLAAWPLRCRGGVGVPRYSNLRTMRK
jgi:hypothetical protein